MRKYFGVVVGKTCFLQAVWLSFFVAVFLVAGGVFWLIQNDFLLVRFLPSYYHNDFLAAKSFVAGGREKKVLLFSPLQDVEPVEATVLNFRDDENENLRQLISSWMKHVYTVGILSKSVIVKSVAICSEEAYVAFDSEFLDSEWSAVQKLRFVEALLKTVKRAASSVSFIHFIVLDRLCEDFHLDFSQRWPVEGFL